jgi:hypothetical protein
VSLSPFQYAYNGLTFGAGTDVQVSGIPVGLRDLPPVRTGDVPKSRQHGVIAGKNYFADRVIQYKVEVFAPRSHTFEQTVASVSAAFPNVTDPAFLLPLSFNLSAEWSEARQVWCRPTKTNVPIDPTYGVQHMVGMLELRAPDPLIYSLTRHSVSAGLPSPTAGLHFPVTFPATFGASTGGSMVAVNAGTENTYPVVTITGPCTTPSVSLASTGQFLTVSLTLGASDTLVIDMGARTITLNGTASRANQIVTGSSWWGLPPGSNTIGVSSQDSASVAALFTCAWYDAWGAV